MPLYSIDCPCGNRETLSPVREDDQAECDECGMVVSRATVHVVSFRGDFHTASSEVYNAQLDMTFPSRSAFEEYLETNGLHVASHAEGQRVRDEAAEGAERLAKREGYRDRADKKARLKGDLRDRVAANRERVAQEYADAHGSEGKAAADDVSAWGEALPS